MRFEIRGGGFFMILVGILGLSSAVFVFGLLAGYDVGRQSASATQEVATTYSIPSAPLVTASSAPAASAPAAPAPEAAPPEAAENPPETDTDSGDTEAKPVKAPAAAGDMGSGEGVANDEAPPADEGAAPPAAGGDTTRTASAGPSNPDATDDTDNAANDDEAPPPKRHGFNIQIQAAMDLSGANQMIRRLQKIGYPAHLVATPIDGQTWYKVEVGPYPSQDAAASAQTAMRQKYNDEYGHGGAAGAASSAPPSAAEGGTSDSGSATEE